MKKLRNVLTSLLNILAGASLIAMVALTCWQVFTRYILQNPSPWSEELVAYLFAWTSLLGASIITGERGHMNIPIVTDHFTPGIQKLSRNRWRAYRICLFPDHPGIRRHQDHKPRHGTDDLCPGRCCRCVLCGNAFMRYFKHDLYSSQHRGYLKKRRHHGAGRKGGIDLWQWNLCLS